MCFVFLSRFWRVFFSSTDQPHSSSSSLIISSLESEPASAITSANDQSMSSARDPSVVSAKDPSMPSVREQSAVCAGDPSVASATDMSVASIGDQVNRPSQSRESTSGICENFICDREQFHTCQNEGCQSILCFEHIMYQDECINHKKVFASSSMDNTNFTSFSETDTCDSERNLHDDVVIDKSESTIFNFQLDPQILDEINLGTTPSTSGLQEQFVLDITPDMLLPSRSAVGESLVSPLDVQRDRPTDENDELIQSFSGADTQPEMYAVDGLPCENKTPPKSKIKRDDNKRKRDSGLSYKSVLSGKIMPARRKKPLGPGCDPERTRCFERNFMCIYFTDEQRQEIRNAYFETGDLQAQREWLARYVDVRHSTAIRKNSQRDITLLYSLPTPADMRSSGLTTESRARVCKKMFRDTLGISDRQIRTAIDKTSETGVVEKERRGGRPKDLKTQDEIQRAEVKAHINQFPRMESHFCRQSTGYEYLSPDLNISTMYQMYKTEHPQGASMSTYQRVFSSMKLKFHTPKKDQCGICTGYHDASPEEKERLQATFERHTAEKETVRSLKDQSKALSLSDENADVTTASFDLQQVIYLPLSQRSEIFYKRRLACYNFTVYDIGKGKGYCYLSHEGQTKRGANEIASGLHDFLITKDKERAKEINLFSDGCPGQNKNSILPGMLHHFITHSESVNAVTLNFFETNHGQNEGDAMHSVIERKVRKMGDVFLPSQLSTMMTVARKKGEPYKVKEVSSTDVLDWKAYSIALGFLRCRRTEEGKDVSWKDFMSIKFVKEFPQKFYMKMSHLEKDFAEVSLHQGRRHAEIPDALPNPAYEFGPSRPKLAEAKYNDLMALASGDNPVIKHPDHVQFFTSLPH